MTEGLVVTALALALTAYFTYPLAARLDQLGRIDTDDGRLSIWNVAWVARALIEEPRYVFDANIFYPHRRTLAFSEANLVAGALAVPGYWVTRDPFVAHNMAVLLAFVLAIVGSYYLARRVSGSRQAAVLSATLFAFCPFMFARTAHIQLQMIAGLPFCLVALHRFVDRPTVARSLVIALAVAVQGLACAYYGIFAGLTIGAGFLFYAVSRGLWRRRRYWALAAAAGVVSVLLVFPFLLPYLELQQDTGFSRSLAEARWYSADWRAYFASSAWAHEWMLPRLGRWNEVLFPGYLATVLGLAGIWLGLRPRAARADQVGSATAVPPAAVASQLPSPRTVRESTLFYTLVGGLALWTSLGPQAGLYSLLYHLLPVFSLLRAPARAGIIVTLALAVLTALTVARWLRALPRRRGVVLTVGLVAVAILELQMAMPYKQVPPPDPVYTALRHARPGAVAEFPFFFIPGHLHRHATYMLNSTYHWQPLINGYSDFIPEDFREMMGPLATFPSTESFAVLRSRRVRYVVVHVDLFPLSQRASVLARLDYYRDYLRAMVPLGAVRLYEIVKWPEALPAYPPPGSLSRLNR